MKRKKPNRKAAQDSPVLRQIAKLIDARLPDNHGFALLTFPFGASVDGRIRYVGTGHREDILGMMETWIAHQRGHGWGHDPATSATQFTTAPPSVAGYYVLKSSHETTPELVELVKQDDDLLVHQWNGQGFEPTMDLVKDLCRESHIWLGPLPEPWKAPADQGELARDPNAGDPEAQVNSIAMHHAEFFGGMTEAYYLEVQGRTNSPDEPLPDFVKGIIQDALGHGYAQGIAQQLNNPYRPV